MDPAVASALIGAGGSFASGIGNILSFGSAAHYQRKNMRAQKDLNLELMAQQNAYNKALYEQQFGDELKLWEKNRGLWYEQFNAENAYNDPAAQRARLERAGFNPYAMLGSSGMPGMSSATMSSPGSSVPSANGVSASGVSIPSPSQMDFSFIGQAVKDAFSASIAYGQAKQQNAAADMASTDAQYRTMKNVYEMGKMKLENDKLANDILNSIKDQRQKDAVYDYQDMVNTLFNYTFNAQRQRIEGEAEQVAYQNALIDTQNQSVQTQIQNMILERAVMAANIQVSYAQIRQIAQTIRTLAAQEGNYNADTQKKYIEAVGQIIGNGQAAKLFQNLDAIYGNQVTKGQLENIWTPWSNLMPIAPGTSILGAVFSGYRPKFGK